MAAEKENALTKRDFSKVILTLENVLIPDDKLSPTPSSQDGLDSETEQDLRILGCELIQMCGILLKLPQVSCQKIFHFIKLDAYFPFISAPKPSPSHKGSLGLTIYANVFDYFVYFVLMNVGGDGNWPGAFPAILLFKVIRQT